MSTLRAQLAETAPDLHAALERSWQIALEDWLPAIAPSMDSFNSYPHLRNIENHLDQVLLTAESLSHPHATPKLRPVEIYLLLASVLFHDFGRTASSLHHAAISQRKILRDYGNLGIPSQELAKCVADVSLAHDPPESWLPSNLYDVVIDPYGEVRLRALRALLVLGDHMDGAFNRVAPAYVKTSGDLGIVGLFRRHVRGVYADCQRQMVRVVLSDMRLSSTSAAATSRTTKKTSAPHWLAHYSFIDPNEITDAWRSSGFNKRLCRLICSENLRTAQEQVEEEHEQNQRENSVLPNRRGTPAPADDDVSGILRFLQKNCRTNRSGKGTSPVCKGIAAWFEPLKGQPTFSPLWQLLPHSSPRPNLWPTGWEKDLSDKEPFEVLSLWDWMVVMNLLNVRLGPAKPLTATDSDQTWPHPALLAVLMRDALCNSETLLEIRDDLAAFGVPLRAWLLDHREHLYTPLGLETYEPVLHKEFLKRVAVAMWDLSLGVFGCSRFTYEELASQAHEPNANRVRQAARRLAIIERCEFFEVLDSPTSQSSANPTKAQPQAKKQTNAIWVGENQWRWSEPFSPAPQCGYCRYLNNCRRFKKRWHFKKRTGSLTSKNPGLNYLRFCPHWQTTGRSVGHA